MRYRPLHLRGDIHGPAARHKRDSTAAYQVLTAQADAGFQPARDLLAMLITAGVFLQAGAS